jgi:hypothetical protein
VSIDKGGSDMKRRLAMALVSSFLGSVLALSMPVPASARDASKDGRDGRSGRDGQNGKDGKDGRDSVDIDYLRRS